MKKMIFVSLLLLIFCGCSSQNLNGQDDNKDTLAVNKPQTKIEVNKEYDENGNLISFDSSYSYYYSNVMKDSLSGFNTFSTIQKPYLDDIFFEDSLLNYDFYKDDFFSQRFKLNNERMSKLFQHMDSLKNSFFEIQKKGGKKKSKTKDP